MTTDSNPELGTRNTPETLVDAIPERDESPEPPETAKSHLTYSHLRGRALEYFRPPRIMTARPADVPALLRYARVGSWTKSENGAIRKAGVAYWHLIGLPTTVVCRYVEWIAQRPGRALIVFLLWRLVISNRPGPWVVQNVFSPIGSIAKWLFL